MQVKFKKKNANASVKTEIFKRFGIFKSYESLCIVRKEGTHTNMKTGVESTLVSFSLPVTKQLWQQIISMEAVCDLNLLYIR